MVETLRRLNEWLKSHKEQLSLLLCFCVVGFLGGWFWSAADQYTRETERISQIRSEQDRLLSAMEGAMERLRERERERH
jgi:hypothetical protein